MQRLALLLLLGLVLLDCTSGSKLFRIIGHLEKPDLGYNKHFEEGGGKEYKDVKYAVTGEEGDKGYDSQHVEEKGIKELHDKEDHQKEFAEVAGEKASHGLDNGFYEEQHKGEKGEKGLAFEDHGSYAKGHDTKGHHNVHKLNEYKKNTEFFDEDHDEAHKEKHGGFEAAQSESSGGHSKGAHGKGGYIDSEFGKEGQFDKGHHYLDDKGHKKAGGYDGYYENGEEFAKKGGDKGFKGYGFYEKGVKGY